MKMVLEKSWNIKTWQKVNEFCKLSWNLTIFTLEFDTINAVFVAIKKFSISTKSLYFPNFSAKYSEHKI